MEVHSIQNTNFFECPLCGEKFISIHELKTHVFENMLALSLPCYLGQCEVKFENKCEIEMHMKVVHGAQNSWQPSDEPLKR